MPVYVCVCVSEWEREQEERASMWWVPFSLGSNWWRVWINMNTSTRVLFDGIAQCYIPRACNSVLCVISGILECSVIIRFWRFNILGFGDHYMGSKTTGQDRFVCVCACTRMHVCMCVCVRVRACTWVYSVCVCVCMLRVHACMFSVWYCLLLVLSMLCFGLHITPCLNITSKTNNYCYICYK